MLGQNLDPSPLQEYPDSGLALPRAIEFLEILLLQMQGLPEEPLLVASKDRSRMLRESTASQGFHSSHKRHLHRQSGCHSWGKSSPGAVLELYRHYHDLTRIEFFHLWICCPDDRFVFVSITAKIISNAPPRIPRTHLVSH